MTLTRVVSLRADGCPEAKSAQRRAFRRFGLIGALTLAAFSGCVTGSMEKAYAQMDGSERAMAEKLARIQRGMTGPEVQAIMGGPAGGTNGAWRYDVNSRTVTGTMTITPSNVTQTQTDVIAVEAVADVFFKNGHVTKVRFVHPALGGSMHGFCVYFVK